MRPPRPPRDPERGNSLLLALIVMSALATLGSLTVVSMQSSIQMSTNDRAQTIAMYAAESGAAVAMDFLRKHFDASGTAPFNGATSWSAYCTANNQNLMDVSTVIGSSDARPGSTDPAHPNLFDPDQNAWFHIDILNNRSDQSYGQNTPNCDTDGILIIRSTGHGPQGSLAIVEWEVQRVGFWGSKSMPAPLLASGFALPDPTDPDQPHNPPSLTGGWSWTPVPAPTPTSTSGMVLLGWRIVSL
jgi:Tfp pilus assembly protein PilX